MGVCFRVVLGGVALLLVTSAAVASSARVPGGQGALTAQSIGLLQLGHATPAQARAFAGPPRWRWTAQHAGSYTGSKLFPGTIFRGQLWGYGCPGLDRYGLPCTLYGFVGGHLTSFQSGSTSFVTRHGGHVGLTYRQLLAREPGSRFVKGRCPPYVRLAAPAGQVFIAFVDDQHGQRIAGFHVGGANGSFRSCGG
jgi:hypothetical protein